MSKLLLLQSEALLSKQLAAVQLSRSKTTTKSLMKQLLKAKGHSQHSSLHTSHFPCLYALKSAHFEVCRPKGLLGTFET